MTMTNDSKRALARLLIDQASLIVEFWPEYAARVGIPSDIVSASDAAEQLATWLKNLPGDSWSTFLPDPH